MNGFKVTILMLALMILFAWIGMMIGGQGGMIIAFVIAMVMNFVSYWYSHKIVLKMYRAREVTEADHPRLIRVVRRIATTSTVPMPKVYIVPSKAPNAFATGRNEDNAAVAVTEGLLEILDEDELEGVLCHEFAHIMNKDMLIGTIVATFAGAIGILATIARWGAIFGGMGRRDNDNIFGLLIAALVAPIVALIIKTAISRQREFKADKIGAKITGKYLPLASALEKLHQAPVRMNLDKRPATAHLMIANPISGRKLLSLFSTHPPVKDRVEKLHKLAQASIYRGYAE